VAPTIRQFFQQFPDDDTCLRHLFETRFGQEHVCPSCKRSAKWYRIKKEPAFSCQWCGYHVHPMAGTLFEDTRTPLQDWFYAIYLFTTSRHGVPAKELQRQLGVTYKTAWRMGHEIRKHMAAVDGDPPLSGQVEAEETYVGGVNTGAGRGRGLDNKTILFGMVKRGGHAMTKVIEEADRDTLMREIGHNVRRGSTIHTDEYKGYRGLQSRGYKHKTVNHGQGEYASEDGRGTQTVEGYFSRLKNSIRGTHVRVSGKHLQKYAGEFEYRYNSRHRPSEMLDELLSVYPTPDEE
jgi:transposase-like protein